MRMHPLDAPFGIATPAEAAGWHDMYPHDLVFTAESRAADETRGWVYDGIHHPKVKYPFDSVVNEAIRLAKGQWTSRVFQLPGSFGTEHRLLLGRVYVAPVSVTDERTRAARATTFTERSAYYYRNWNRLHRRWNDRMTALIAETAAIVPPMLPEVENNDVLTTGTPAAASGAVIGAYHRLIEAVFTAWQYHFEMLTLGYVAYENLYRTARHHFPGIADQQVAELVPAVPGAQHRVDTWIGDLATAAGDHGIGELIVGHGFEAGGKAVTETEAGRRWWDRFHDAMAAWPAVTMSAGLDHTDLPLRDEPAVVWSLIGHRLKGGTAAGHEGLQAQSDTAFHGYLNLLTDAEQRENFEQAVRLARRVSRFVEEHGYYVENRFHQELWAATRRFGRLLVDLNVLTDVDDVFCLNRWELERVLFHGVTGWAIGTGPVAAVKGLSKPVADRRRLLAVMEKWEPAAVLGSPQDSGDPVMPLLYGITGASNEDGGLRGCPASPGVARGPVRIVADGSELELVRPGDIVVTTAAAPNWATMLRTAGGLVTEVGGVMSHVAIVAREAGIPTALGVSGATSTLKTGQHVEVDGGTGTVTLVEEHDAG